MKSEMLPSMRNSRYTDLSIDMGTDRKDTVVISYMSLILARRVHSMFHKSYIFTNSIKVMEYIL